MNLYFAYGSNMDQIQMRERCPSAILLGTAMLADYRLAFTIYSPKRKCGCADIVRSAGDRVYGLLYQLTDKDMTALDGFEYCPTHYQRIIVRVSAQDGGVDAYSYEVVNKEEGLIPSSHYIGLLQSAAVLHNFPGEYKEFLHTFKTLA